MDNHPSEQVTADSSQQPATQLAVPCSIDQKCLRVESTVERSWALQGRGHQTESLAIESPRVVSMRVAQTKVQVRSYFFAAPADDAQVDSQKFGKSNRQAKTKPTPKTASANHGKLRPPKDIIKLKDRLFYVLQPPLATLFKNSSLTFPFSPFPYQLDGIAFLFVRHAAILADEMGLGKTMQAISTVRLLLHAGKAANILLVCPKPLVSNWQREFQLWAPEVTTTVVSGDQRKRHWLWNMNDVPVKIANYELLVRDADFFEEATHHFDLVILDEAQRIKNRSSSTSKVIHSIQRTRSWALTGTPIENSSEDLVGIFEFVSPGYLNPGMKAKSLNQATRDHIIRRTKDKVLTDLPPKMFRDASVELSSAQRRSYELAEESGVIRLNNMGSELTVQHVFELVLRLKQICNFDPATQDSSKLERLEADMEEVAASGHKAIIFSQWVETLRFLAERLKRFHPLEYHGRVPSKQRDGVIERFRNNPKHNVILMSYGAGSVGLNLQFSRYVFLFDRWWNPAVEDQAINRAHRIGADGPVTVTRFLTQGTIEERIDQVLEQKRELFNEVLGDSTASQHAGLSREEVFGLFDLRVSGTQKRVA